MKVNVRSLFYALRGQNPAIQYEDVHRAVEALGGGDFKLELSPRTDDQA